MGVNFSISGLVVDLIIFIVIAGNAIYSYRKGLSNILFSFLSLILAVVLTFVLYKPVTNYILENTDFQQRLENILGEKLSNSFGGSNNENEEIVVNSSNPIMKTLGDEASETIKGAKKDVVEIISSKLSLKIIKIATVLILFIAIRILLFIVNGYINVIAKLPIINVIDGTGGMIYGVIKGFIVVYIVLAILSLILPILGNNIVYDSIENAKIGNIMFNKNVLLNLIIK